MKRTKQTFQNYDDLHHFLNESSDFSFLLDSAFTIVCASEAAKNFFTVGNKTILGLSFSDLLTQFSLGDTDSLINELKGNFFSAEKKIDFNIKNKKHNVIVHILKFSVKKNFSENFFLINGAIDHKIQKKHKEWDLGTILCSDSKEVPSAFFSSFIRSMPGIIFWKDVNSVYRGCNRTYLDLFGFKSVDEVIGLTDEDIGHRLNWSKEVIQSFIKDDQEVLSNKRVIVIEDKVVFNDNKEHILLVTKAPILNESGRVIGVLGVSQDITMHKKRELALQQAKETAEKAQELSAGLDAIIRYAPDFIYWKDRNSVHLGCNQRFADFAGLESIEAVVGKTDFDFPWKEQAESFRKNDAEVIRSGQPKLNVEEVMINTKGRIASVISNKVPLRNKEGKIIGILGIATEVTQLKETEDKLRNALLRAETANKAKTEFIANMSHDLRTPMTGVVGMLEQLKFTIEDAKKMIQLKKRISASEYKSMFNDLLAESQEYTKFAKLSSDELVHLFNEILETVRLESGEFKAKSVTFNLRDLIEKNIGLLKSVANHKQLTLSFDIDNNVPPCFKGLLSCIDRCLLNLMSNALKFTDKGSVIIHVTAPDAKDNMAVGDSITLHIAIKDTGIGIPADKFDTIFEHFSRLTSSYRGVYKGSGLGLYAVKKYLEVLKGDITLTSEVGKGSCFTLIIPLKVGDAAKVVAGQDEEKQEAITSSLLGVQQVTPTVSNKPTVSDKNKARILLVEDQPIVEMTTRLLLERLGCAVDVARTGSQALDKAGNYRYDLIFMDVGLPDLEGTEVAKRIRKFSNEEQSQVPIIALTGHAGDSEKRQQCFDAGIQDVLSKPPQTSVIEQTLAKWIWQPKDGVKIAKETAVAQPSSDETSLDSMPLIDWAGSLKRFNNDREMLVELLAKMPESLKESQAILTKAYTKKDIKALREELHRMLGAVVFFVLPRLKQATLSFQEIVKAEPQNAQQIESAYHDLDQTINDFCEAYERGELVATKK